MSDSIRASYRFVVQSNNHLLVTAHSADEKHPFDGKILLYRICETKEECNHQVVKIKAGLMSTFGDDIKVEVIAASG